METFRHDPFGIITIRRRQNARNICITIETDSLSISVNQSASIDYIVKFIEDHRDKILEDQQRLKTKRILVNEDFKIENRYFTLRICKDDGIKNYLFVLQAENSSIPYQFVMRCNSNIDFEDNDTQTKMLNAINKIICNIAKSPLTMRTVEIASKLGFEINNVKVKIEKTKWGSCSINKNINLSAHLILLPQHLIDFIIIHELCHLKEMNHSKHFHELVNAYTDGKEVQLEKELKQYSTNILNYKKQADV